MRPSLVVSLVGLALAGCAPVVSASTLPPPGVTEHLATETLTPTSPPTLTATWTPEPSATATFSPTPPAREGCAAGLESCILEWPLPFQRPIHEPGNAIADPTYRYGATQDGAREPHHGIDLPNEFGTPVYAAGDGAVVFAGSDTERPVSPWPNFYGNVVVLEHELPGVAERVYTLYGHLSQVEVVVGQPVTAGQEIGKVGLSGVAVGSHLHFEVRIGANDYASTRDPELWLAPASPAGGMPLGVLAIRVAEADGRLVPTILNVEKFDLPDGTATSTHPVEAYQTREKFPVNADDVLGENFLLGSLSPGRYRVTFVYWGALYERWVNVASGRLTYVPFSVP